MFQNKKVHLIGIGGVSMSGIAEMLLSLGAIVTGSDPTTTKITDRLEKEGIKVFKTQQKENVHDKDIVIYTAAIKEDNPERMEAQALHLETYERAEFLGKLMLLYQNCLCISGTHGKSTTTGMVSSIFLKANLNPTIQIGAILPLIDSTSYIGDNRYLIMEACEYVDSFLSFHPTSAIITNIDNDHLDYFHNLDNIKKSFAKYVSLLPLDGFLVMNIDDENSKDLKNNTKAKVITFGLNKSANYYAQNIEIDKRGHSHFDVYQNQEFFLHLDLNIQGEHNVYNALAAIALSWEYIHDKNIIKEGLVQYRGVERRFEYIGKVNKALIYDDYAHHPTEIKTTLETAQKVKHNKSWAIFQSHTYSRTKEHLDAFADVLSNFDNIIIAPIYAAREINTFNIDENMLVDKIKVKNKNVLYLDSFAKIATYLKENVQENDLVITIGAGPINKVAQIIKEED